MAIAYSGRMGTATKASKSITVNSVASGSLLVATIHAFKYSYGQNNLVSGVTSGGGAYAWTLAKRQVYAYGSGANHTVEVSIWYRENSASGNTTAVFTDVGVDDYYWNWAEFTGAATSSSLDKTNGASDGNGATSPLTTGSTGTLSQADSLAISIFGAPYLYSYAGPGVGTTMTAADGAGDPTPMGGRSIYYLPNSTTALDHSYTYAGTNSHGAVAAIATFKGATTQKRIEITNIDTAVNGTTGWTVYYWQTDGTSQTVWRVTGLSAESTGGKIYLTSAQAASAGATFPNLADGTTVNCIAYRPGGSPVKGLVGVVVGTIKDYT